MRPFSRAILACIAILGVFSAHTQYAGSRAVPSEWKRGFDSITPTDARAWVFKLAGPEFGGRSPREPGYDLAAQWVAGQLQSFGVEPAGENGTFFQKFTLQSVRLDPANAELFIEGTETRLALNQDYTLYSSADFDVRARLVFVRVVADSPVPGLDASVARGSIVILSDGSQRIQGDAVTTLTRIASDAGAIAVVEASSDERRLTSPTRSAIKELAGDQRAAFTNFMIGNSAARRLAVAAGAANFATAEATTSSIEQGTKEIVCRGKPTRTDQFQTVNVLGKVVGADPAMKGEIVAIGSHLDHIGTTSSGIGWGADDNASGCTANLLVARAAASNPVKPKRTLLFAFWSCEELGLWGSSYYVARPSFPLSATIAYLNMDMVGRNSEFPRWNDRPEDNENSIYVSSVKYNSRDLYKLLVGANDYVNLLLREDKEDRGMRSDTGSFIRMGVPTLKAFTGEHPDYHRVTDTPDKINYTKIANVAKWLFVSAQLLATQSERPRFEPGARYLTGRVTYLPRVALTQDATVEITLVDVTVPDAEVVLDVTRILQPGQVPIVFSLRHDSSQVRPDGRYVVRVHILDRGALRFSNGAGTRVLTGGAPVSNLEITVEASG